MPLSAIQSIGATLAAVLRERIATGVYAPGVWIRESALAEEFGYSNGPIREALQTLANEQLLVREPWRGVRVVELSGEEIIEIFQLRMALLDLAAELAVKHVDAAQLKVAKNMLKKLEAALARGDIETQMALGNQLSHWVCDGSRNLRLAQNWSRLTSQTRMYIHASLRASTDPAKVSEPWHELVAAIEGRDRAAARLAARHLVQRTLLGLGLDSGL